MSITNDAGTKELVNGTFPKSKIIFYNLGDATWVKIYILIIDFLKLKCPEIPRAFFLL